MDILFYDGNCPMCLKEINILERHKGDGLQLINIHDNDAHDIIGNLTNIELLSVLHLRTSNGIWLKGLDATVGAWKHTKFAWLFAPLRWPLIEQVADWLYYRWANKRACRLGYCN